MNRCTLENCSRRMLWKRRLFLKNKIAFEERKQWNKEIKKSEVKIEKLEVEIADLEQKIGDAEGKMAEGVINDGLLKTYDEMKKTLGSLYGRMGRGERAFGRIES